MACSGEMVVNGKVRRHLINHYGYLDIDRFLLNLFDYLKAPAISGNPSHSIWMAFCTMFTQTSMFVGIFECEDWYVKFSIDSEGKAHLNVLSANIDGYIH